MKKLVLIVLLVACGKKGSDAPKGDCAASVEHAVTLSAEDYKKSNITAEMIAKIKEVSIVRCKEDKWSEAILECLADAKASADVGKCQQQMTREQNENMAKAITAVTAAAEPTDPGSGAGLGSAEPGAGSAQPGGSTTATGALPAECADYKALVEKVVACDKLPQPSRDTIKQALEVAEKAWGTLDTLPADAKSAAIAGCKTAADAVRKTAAACNL